MKATFFTLAAWAASVIAAPAADNSVAVAQRAPQVQEVDQAVHQAETIVVEGLGVGQIVDGATGNDKRDITNAAGLVHSLQTLLDEIKLSTKSINSTIEGVKAGSIQKDAATTDASKDLASMHFQLSQIVHELTAAAGIPVPDSDVDVVLGLVVTLLAEVLATVNSLVTILGLRVQLVTLLNAVFLLLAKVLTLVIGLVAALVPGLVAALSPLLAALGNGLLAPLLTPIVALVAGLAVA